MFFINLKSAVIYCAYIKIVSSFIIFTIVWYKNGSQITNKMTNTNMYVILQISYCLTPLEFHRIDTSFTSPRVDPAPSPDVCRRPDQYPGHFRLLFVPCPPLFFLILILQSNIWLSPGQISVHFLNGRSLKFSYSPFLS